MHSFHVVYSTFDSNDLLNFVTDKYNIDASSSIRFIKRGFNDTYLITESTGKHFILRVYKHGWKNIANIATEVDLLMYLHENNLSISVPIVDKNNTNIHPIDAPEGARHLVLFSFAEGDSIRKLSVQQSYLLGEATGKIHQLTSNKSGKTAFQYDFDKQFENILNITQPLLKKHPEAFNRLIQIKKECLNKWASIEQQQVAIGLCHGDLQAENFHIDKKGTITFFDFDFMGYGPLVYDIGVFIWYDHKNKSQEVIQSFLQGYQTQRRLTTTEIKLLPYFSTLRALFQMSLYCHTNNGKQLPLWPTEEVAAFISKVQKWLEEQKRIKYI